MSRLYKFQFAQCAKFLFQLAHRDLIIDADGNNHGFTCFAGEKIFSLRLPLFFPAPYDCEKLWQYLNRVDLPLIAPDWNLLLMEAGRAAIAAVSQGEIIHHKNIRKYMVRKKQGKSQLTHMKTKGKSRYGSRLRLREAEAYFDEIIERLQMPEYNSAPFTFLHCPVRLRACLNEAAEESSFDLNHFTWRRLAVNVREASFDELQRLSREPLFCRLTVEEEKFLSLLPSIPDYQP